MGFLTFRILDLIDILVVAFLLYEVYMMIKGTVAINVFVILFTSYLLWLLVRALNMQLLGTIMGQVMGVGVVAVIIVFQQELRRFFIMVSNNYFSQKTFSLESLFTIFSRKEPATRVRISQIVTACRHMAMTKTGAIIAIAKNSELNTYADTGEQINADTSSRLLETIFFKNSPLHDGAAIIDRNKIYAAGCVLPISSNRNLPKALGLRHRAALGLSETTDAFIIIVSEETGYMAYAQYGKIFNEITPEKLTKKLREEFPGKVVNHA